MFVRAAVIAALLGATSAPGQAVTAPEPAPELQPVRIVVLVDESSSLSAVDAGRERDAALEIAQGEPSPRSTVAVVGFGSGNAPGQSAVGPVCPPTKLDTPQHRQALADCVGQIHRRDQSEGDGTDHVTALRTALSYLGSGGDDQPKLVYLLTDGVLDVGDSPAYGDTADHRNAAAKQQLPGVLADLAHAGIRVWPLGFGNVDRAQLESFATGAGQDKCGVNTPKPSATVINGSGDLLRAIGEASQAARCTSVSPASTGTLHAGGSIDLSLDVPAIASEGALLVYKRDPRVTVSYHDPQGRTVPVNGSLDGSRFSLTGQGSGTEALHIVDPAPGRWTVHLAAPSDLPDQDVAAVATFQGAVRAVINVMPPVPEAGKPVDVSMQVRGTRGAITDPAQLQGLSFTAELTGDGFPPVAPVQLTDGDGHGDFAGKLTVPAGADGNLNFIGSVTGIGVSGDRRLWPTRVASGATAGVNAVITLDGVDDDVTIGDSVHGTVEATNNTGQARKLRLQVVNPSSGAVLSADPGELALSAAGANRLDFQLRFAANTVLGGNQAQLQVVDESNNKVVGQLIFARTVVPVPTLLDRLRWVLVSLAVLLLATGLWLLVRWQREKKGRNTLGVKVELRRHGSVIDSITARTSGEKFEFGLRQGFEAALTSNSGNGADAYCVTKTRRKLTLRRPGGARHTVDTGGQIEVGDGLALALHQPGSRSRPATRTTAPPRPTRPAAADDYDEFYQA